MKRQSKFFAFLLTAAMLLSFLFQSAGAASAVTGVSSRAVRTVHDLYAAGTVLRMATGYNLPNTGISFDANTAGAGIRLADGVTYRAGDLKPTWAAVSERLSIAFEDRYQGNSAVNEWNYWMNMPDQVDMVSGNADQFNEYGAAGSLVNIADYLDLMPNFKAFLDAHPVVRLSITGDTDTGAIYYSPYFDGVDDVERMPLMRTDWVERLLNGSGPFTASASSMTAVPAYVPYMPTSGSCAIESVSADGKSKIIITKNYDAYGNIIAKMNEKGSMSGVDAVNMLREYIDAAYGGYYGTNRADLFIGQNACWDADELVALLRCVVANPQTLNGTGTVYGLFSRDDSIMHKLDLFRFAGTLFGVRGMESRKDYLYVGNDGRLHDARLEADTYEALERMYTMVREGLISESFVKNQGENTRTMLERDMGFMGYDYSQNQTLYNEDGTLQAGEMYRPVMVPVARWNDGTGEAFFRFTESWRSVRTDGWAISRAGVGGDDNKLYAALALIDYAYSTEGQILMSYGPDAFIRTNASGSYVTFNFNGEQWPEISDAARSEMWALSSGNYINYARNYLGSNLSFIKSQAFEYQCTTEAGRLGAGYISNAIGLGVIRHPVLGIASNPWYISVPTLLPTDRQQNDVLTSYTELNTRFSSSSDNIPIDIIINGYANVPASSAAGVAAYVADSWHGSAYLSIQNNAWELDRDFCDNLGYGTPATPVNPDPEPGNTEPEPGNTEPEPGNTEPEPAGTESEHTGEPGGESPAPSSSGSQGTQAPADPDDPGNNTDNGGGFPIVPVAIGIAVVIVVAVVAVVIAVLAMKKKKNAPAAPAQPPTEIGPAPGTEQPRTFKFCTKCGTQVPIGARFCPKCGNPLENREG